MSATSASTQVVDVTNPSEAGIAESVVANVGIERSVQVGYDGPTLVVAEEKTTAGLKVRLDGPTETEDGLRYEIHFVGSKPGTYQVKDFLTHSNSDQRAALPSLEIIVRTVLPRDFKGELAGIDQPPMVQPLRYRLLMVVLVTIWLVPLAWLGLRRVA